MAIKDRLHLPEPLRKLQAKVGQDDISGAAAEMAYRFFLAIFPPFLFLLRQVAPNSIARHVGLGAEGHRLISIVRWPIAIALLLLAIDIIFWAAPNVQLPFSWITPGAAIAVITWLACSFGFGVYVSHF